MAQVKISAAAVIDAPPPVVYGILADYRDGHPRILPERWFSGLEVVHGGVGAGTRIRFQLRIWGTTRSFEGEVTEPEPGRLLVETYGPGEVTSFLVEPADGGCSAVTIFTEWPAHWFTAPVQRWLVSRMLLPIYQQELKNLAQVAAERRT